MPLITLQNKRFYSKKVKILVIAIVPQTKFGLVYQKHAGNSLSAQVNPACRADRSCFWTG